MDAGRWIAGVLLVSAMLSVGGLPAQAARPVLDWLNYDASARNDYAINTDTGDSARHSVEPSWAPEAQRRTAKLVMLLIPKRSEIAYSTSVNTILQVFRQHGLPVRFAVWFYDENDAVAQEALEWSYAQPVDLIMSVGSVATAYLHAHHRGNKIPAVTSASKDPVASGQVTDPKAGSGTNIAYTSINVATDTLVAYLRRLVPNLTTIGVLYSRDNDSAIKTQAQPLHDAAGELGLTVVDISVENDASAEAELDVAVPAGLDAMRDSDPDLKRSVLLVTGSTPVYERIAQVNRHAGRVPVVSMLPDVVRPGPESALLSIGVNQSSAVALAAVYAKDVLLGRADPATLPVGTVSPPDLAINFLVAQRIGIQIPFSFFESATFVYDPDGRAVIEFGQRVGG
ncbi:ABC transporter substrate binding protein [Thalassobaculum sp.]|uniref:ABC transporter substrate binding protein n=1 Tax=Thalassobaculum sp. TaxID=2022740 RepID=UPI0032EB9463